MIYTLMSSLGYLLQEPAHSKYSNSDGLILYIYMSTLAIEQKQNKTTKKVDGVDIKTSF